MSKNLDLVRSIYAAWERGDFSSTDWAHPEIEFIFADGPSPGSWSGVAGMAEAWFEFLEVWQDYSAVAEEYLELGDEIVLTLTVFGARGKTSGLDVGKMHAKGASVQHVRDGQVRSLVLYFDRDRAFADLGLAEFDLEQSRAEAAGLAEEGTEGISQENVEVVRTLMEAVHRRDIDTFARVTTPDFEWYPVFAARVEGDVYRGREGIEAFLGEVDEIWEEFRPVPEEYRDLGDRVLGLGRLKTRGRGSGVPIDAPWGGVYDVRDGKVSRIRTYLDHGEALRAAGLPE